MKQYYFFILLLAAYSHFKGYSQCGPDPTCTGTPATNYTILTGTGSSSSNTPFGYYEANRHQWLYTQAEINASGMGAGSINQISWNGVLDMGETVNFTNYTIKMGCTTASDLSGGFIGGLTTVWGPSTVTAASIGTGWGNPTMTLTTPYYWGNTCNLVVEVCSDKASQESVTSMQTNNTVSNMSRMTSATSGSGCALSGGATNMLRPIVRFRVKSSCSPSLSGCIALPVELLSFDVNKDGSAMRVRCDWSTGSEQSSDYFAIERSTDGVTFSNIGTRQAAGNSSTIQYYTFYDNEPYYGLSYYRLKQVDYNGQYEYFPPRPVYIGTPEIISIYPNPSSDYIQYLIASEEGGAVTVKVIDVLGREVINNKETVEKGVATKKLSIAELSRGSYLLVITTDKQEKTQKQFAVK